MSKSCSGGSNSPFPLAGGVGGGRATRWAARPTPLRLGLAGASLSLAPPPASGRGAAIALLLLAACSSEPTAAEKKAAEDRAVAQVEAVQKQKPPPEAIVPQPILFGDIQKFNLFGAGCAFAPGNSMGAVLLTRPKVAYILIDGRPIRFASDPGSTRLPLDTVSRYVGKEMALSLTRSGESASETRWTGHLVVTDAFDQVVYESDGNVQCGA